MAGRIGFKSRIGFGASGLGTMYQPVSDAQAEQTLIGAYQAGMRYFDTAPLYGHGLSELRLGRFLRTVPRESFTVSTKVGRYLVPPRGEPVDYGIWAEPLRLKPIFDYSYDGTMRSLEQSASRLGFSDYDLVYIHDVDRFTHGDAFERRFDQAMEGCYRALVELRAAGHVRAIGIGVNGSDVATRFLRSGAFDAVMIAGRYTLLEQGALADLLPEAQTRNVEVVAAGVYNSGILAASPAALADASYDYGKASAGIVARVRRIMAICRTHDIPLQAAAAQFAFGHPAVACVVLGMSQPDHVAQNMAWATLDIPAGFWTHLKDAGLLDRDVPIPAGSGVTP